MSEQRDAEKALVRKELYRLAEPGYREFAGGLLPGVQGLIGVRLPKLRRLAKKIAAGGGEEYLDIVLGSEGREELFEEIMLQGMVIGYLPYTSEVYAYISRFVPKIDNWSVCDSFCSGLKIAREQPEEMWEFLQPYFEEKEEFRVRFGVVMLINYFVRVEYVDRLFPIFDHIRHEGFYVKMAVAWAVSICYVNFPEKTMDFLENNTGLDDFTYNKALQKITESRCVAGERKAEIRGLRRGLR